MKLEFWFEFGSTYSYPSAMRIENVAKENGIELKWCPFLLGPIFKSQGSNDSPFNINPVKGNYMWRDLERICQAQGLKFKRPAVFPRNGLLAARVACRFSGEDWLPEFVRSVYKANFENDLDISKREIVANCLPLSVAESTLILEEAESQISKELLKANTERARNMGIFGAPSFTVGNELFWGNDRLDAAVNWLLNSMTIQNVLIRDEKPDDYQAISDVTAAAFESMEISHQTEHFIIGALRAANALTVSLVAELDGRVVGHIAFSPVTMSDGAEDWYGLGPVSVHPEFQRKGIGKALIKAGLSRLKDIKAKGCCLVGHPQYYRQFGFENIDGLVHEGVPQEFFFVLLFGGTIPKGHVLFHEGFRANGQPDASTGG